MNEAIVRMDELGAWDFDSKVKQILETRDWSQEL